MPNGMPVKAKVRQGHWKALTFLAVLRHDVDRAAECV